MKLLKKIWDKIIEDPAIEFAITVASSITYVAIIGWIGIYIMHVVMDWLYLL